jgi:hypothetical protein
MNPILQSIGQNKLQVTVKFNNLGQVSNEKMGIVGKNFGKNDGKIKSKNQKKLDQTM